MNIVVVESPAKAQTIERYLGKDYKVLSTYGHVRDLRENENSVDPDQDFRMDWQVDSDGAKRVRDIAGSLKGCERLLLATDPDREGEAISWHLVEALREKQKLTDRITIERVSFHSITRDAVIDAIRSPRAIDAELVDAYIARRALDFLVGFRLSPILWRTIPGARSAGRVQSVAVRLVDDREREIGAFVPREYWTVIALLRTADGATFPARLIRLGEKKIGKFGLPDEAAARHAEAILTGADAFAVSSVVAKPHKQSPQPPFITSTLQQEASRKLGFSAIRTMQTAQRLYESAWITYMRTDGVDMAREAVADARREIESRFSGAHLPARPRSYKTRVKNAQEAHECVRPTDFARGPDQGAKLPGDQAKLYRLIWQRAVASQMADARLLRTTAEIDALDGNDAPLAGLRATGQVVEFEGFRALYREDRDEEHLQPSTIAHTAIDDDSSRRLPPLAAGLRPHRAGVEATQHFTKPPARYTEASLVRKLEELGIGRPSTFASILSVIQKRGYVETSGRSLIPTFLGRVTNAFLEARFGRYVAYDFTAGLEENLDDIAGGRATRSAVLRAFWDEFSPSLAAASEIDRRAALQAVEEALAPMLYPPRSDGVDPRDCPECGEGRLSLRGSRRGNMFLGCERYPDCAFVRDLTIGSAPDNGWTGDRKLGVGPGELPVLLRKGPYGFYFQLGEATEGAKPKRASLPDGADPHSVDLDTAIRYLSLPRTVGDHPETGHPVEVGTGRFGPFVRHQRTYVDIPKDEDLFGIGLNRAMDLLASKSGRGPELLKELGEHPQGGPMQILNGRYGPYVKWGRINASLPKDTSPEELGSEAAVELLAKRATRKPAVRRRK